MRSIAVIKPDMAVTEQDRLGLSPFGLLSETFTQQVLQRARYGMGDYRPEPLELLEEGQAEAPGPVPAAPKLAVQVDLDWKSIWPYLDQWLKQREKNEQKETEQPQQRIVERVVEKIRYRESERRVRVTVEAKGPAIGSRPGGRAPGPGRGETLQKARRPLEPTSLSTAAPAGSGWAPKWQAEHPGLAAQSPLQDRGETPGGGLWERSILLPDVLRRQRTARQGGEQAAVPADGLVYAAEEEVPEATAQMVRQITRAVEQTLARQPAAYRGKQPLRQAEQEPVLAGEGPAESERIIPAGQTPVREAPALARELAQRPEGQREEQGSPLELAHPAASPADAPIPEKADRGQPAVLPPGGTGRLDSAPKDVPAEAETGPDAVQHWGHKPGRPSEEPAAELTYRQAETPAGEVPQHPAKAATAGGGGERKSSPAAKRSMEPGRPSALSPDRPFQKADRPGGQESRREDGRALGRQPEYNSQTAETRRPAVPGKEDIPQATGHRGKEAAAFAERDGQRENRRELEDGTGRETPPKSIQDEEHRHWGHMPRSQGDGEEQEALAYRSQQQEAATRPAAPTAGRPRGAKESPTEHQGERTSAQAARQAEAQEPSSLSRPPEDAGQGRKAQERRTAEAEALPEGRMESGPAERQHWPREARTPAENSPAPLTHRLDASRLAEEAAATSQSPAVAAPREEGRRDSAHPTTPELISGQVAPGAEGKQGETGETARLADRGELKTRQVIAEEEKPEGRQAPADRREQVPTEASQAPDRVAANRPAEGKQPLEPAEDGLRAVQGSQAGEEARHWARPARPQEERAEEPLAYAAPGEGQASAPGETVRPADRGELKTRQVIAEQEKPVARQAPAERQEQVPTEASQAADRAATNRPAEGKQPLKVAEDGLRTAQGSQAGEEARHWARPARPREEQTEEPLTYAAPGEVQAAAPAVPGETARPADRRELKARQSTAEQEKPAAHQPPAEPQEQAAAEASQAADRAAASRPAEGKQPLEPAEDGLRAVQGSQAGEEARHWARPAQPREEQPEEPLTYAAPEEVQAAGPAIPGETARLTSPEGPRARQTTTGRQGQISKEIQNTAIPSAGTVAASSRFGQPEPGGRSLQDGKSAPFVQHTLAAGQLPGRGIPAEQARSTASPLGTGPTGHQLPLAQTAAWAETLIHRHQPQAGGQQAGQRTGEPGSRPLAAMERPAGAGRTPVPPPAPETGEEGELSYWRPQPSVPTPEPEEEKSTLPQWAQEFFQRNPPVKAPAGQSGPTAWSVQPPAAEKAGPAGQMMEWTAPGAVPPGAPIALRTRQPEAQPPQTAAQPPHITEGEVRRAADQIYKIIEERLRRELRRGGR